MKSLFITIFFGILVFSQSIFSCPVLSGTWSCSVVDMESGDESIVVNSKVVISQTKFKENKNEVTTFIFRFPDEPLKVASFVADEVKRPSADEGFFYVAKCAEKSLHIYENQEGGQSYSNHVLNIYDQDKNDLKLTWDIQTNIEKNQHLQATCKPSI